MKAGPPAEKQMIAYLLGELSEPDSVTFEQSCMNDDQLFEELLAVEAELTDAYVQGALVGAQREAFKKRVLNSPDGAKEIEFSKLVTQQISSRSRGSAIAPQTKHRDWSPIPWFSAPSQFLRLPLAAAAALVIALGLGLLFWKKQQPTQSAGNMVHAPQAPTPASKPETSPRAGEPTDQSKRTFVVATFVIASGSERDAGSVNEIRVPSGADRLRFRVDLSTNDYASYQASLRPIDGKGMQRLDDLMVTASGTGTRVFIELPSSALPAGDSMLTLTGVGRNHAVPEMVGRYFVRRTQ